MLPSESCARKSWLRLHMRKLTLTGALLSSFSARDEFQKHGLNKTVELKLANVCKTGFELKDEVDSGEWRLLAG